MVELHKNSFSEKRLRIAIGPVFDEFGGVSQHIFGIKKYSYHNITEVPSKFMRKVLNNDYHRIWLYRKILNKIRLNSYDVMHSHVDPWFIKLCMDSKTNICKWIHTLHTLYFEEDYPHGLQTWQKEVNRVLIDIASKADIKISISKWLHDHLSETYSMQTEIIPNGFDLNLCEKANPDRFKKKYDLKDFILFVGSHSQLKNPRLFVDLSKRMPEAKFVMIGRNLDESHLNEYKISIPKNLFLIGEMRHEDALDAISACDAFVMTSKREGIPTVLLEAMGMGKVVVVPEHTGCKEIVGSNDYGFLYETGSLDSLVEQTEQALVSEHIGRKAHRMVAQKYDWKVLIKKIDAIYNR